MAAWATTCPEVLNGSTHGQVTPQLCTVRHEKPGIGLRCVDTYTLYTQVGACGLTHMGMRMVVSDAPHH